MSLTSLLFKGVQDSGFQERVFNSSTAYQEIPPKEKSLASVMERFMKIMPERREGIKFWTNIESKMHTMQLTFKVGEMGSIICAVISLAKLANPIGALILLVIGLGLSFLNGIAQRRESEITEQRVQWSFSSAPTSKVISKTELKEQSSQENLSTFMPLETASQNSATTTEEQNSQGDIFTYFEVISEAEQQNSEAALEDQNAKQQEIWAFYLGQTSNPAT